MSLHSTAGNAPLRIQALIPAVDELDVRYKNMMTPAYRGVWNEARVAAYLIRDADYVAWEVRQDGPPIWIDADGREFQMMDDYDDRWLATWKFVADRKSVSRDELNKEFTSGISE